MTDKKTKLLAPKPAGPVLRYTGTRPFRQAAGDPPLLPGALVDGSHPYAPIRAGLLERADFVEVKSDG